MGEHNKFLEYKVREFLTFSRQLSKEKIKEVIKQLELIHDDKQSGGDNYEITKL